MLIHLSIPGINNFKKMKNLLLHFFVLSCLLFSATFKLTAQQGHHISATDKTSVHGMLIFGKEKIYASHLPLFHPPHDYQIILELELNSYLDGYDLLVFHLESLSRVYDVSELKVQLHYIKNEIYFSLRNKFLAVSRDLRQSFRDIIKFLFKNMDDESHDHNALKTNFFTALYYQNKHFHHGKERNHRPFKLRTG